MFNEQFATLFQELDADKISFADNSRIRAITTSTPYSGRPIPLIIEIALVVADEVTALEVIALVVVAADTVVLEITLVSIVITYYLSNI